MQAASEHSTAEQNREIEQKINAEKEKLMGFIRHRVETEVEAEDILQDVFYQFVSMYRNMKRIEHTTGWLFQVARNKITDFYRKGRTTPFSDTAQSVSDDGEVQSFADLLPDFSGMPDREFFRELLWEALEDALSELPQNQRDVLVMHEFEDKSFKEIAAQMGCSVNTCLSRKRYALKHLQKRLASFYDELQN